MSDSDTRRGCSGLDPELERELLSLIADGRRPLEIMKKLRDATGVPFQDCKQWVFDHMPREITPCP